MNYYRKPIEKTVDDVKLKMQIGILTLKLSENNNKIDDLLNVDKNIKKDVSDNYNISQINKKKSEFNTELIDAYTNNIKSINSTLQDFENNLSALKKGISDNNKLIQNNISFISSNKKNIGKHIIDFVQLFEIDENSNYKFNRNNNQFTILDKYFLDQSFKIGYLEISYNICIFYANLKDDYHRLNLTFEFYDNNKFIKSIIKCTFNEGNNLLKSILYKNNLYIPLYQDVTKLRIKILLTRYNLRGYGDINVSISNKNSNNFLYIKHLKQSFQK